jgi:hypothetical protein
MVVEEEEHQKLKFQVLPAEVHPISAGLRMRWRIA